MKKLLPSLTAAWIALFPLSGLAQTSAEWLPDSGVKSPYSPLAIPTKLKPVQESLETLLNKGYRISTSTTYSGSGQVFVLVNLKKTVLCVLKGPNPQTDQTVPTSSCWELN